jgi:hypothetical protein
MDPLAAAITAAIIATGGGHDQHIPGSLPPSASLEAQVRQQDARQRRLQYLTSKEGRAYYQEQLKMECQWKFGSLCPR